MRLFRPIALLFFLVLPASAAETDFSKFPFDTQAGEYRGLVVYPDAERSVRLVFLAVTVERPSPDRAVLRIGGDGRVVVQLAEAAGYRTGAVVDFGVAPIVLHSDGGRVSVEALPQAIALPVSDDALGTAILDGARVALSWPIRAAPDMQNAEFALGFDRAAFDESLRAWLAPTNPSPFELGAFDLRGRLAVTLREDLTDSAEPPVLNRVDIDRASANLFDGRIEASGVADLAGGALVGLRGFLQVYDFAGLLQRSAAAGVFVPEAVMPFALLAVALAEETPDGALSFAVETAADGGVIVNGAPTALSLRR